MLGIHSSLHVFIERAFATFKGRFRILDSKPFHPYRTQVKLVLACSILHNWILSFGVDELVPSETNFSGQAQDNTPPQSQSTQENTVWVAYRDSIAQAMWENMGITQT
jgi:hypothetical protein